MPTKGRVSGHLREHVNHRCHIVTLKVCIEEICTPPRVITSKVLDIVMLPSQGALIRGTITAGVLLQNLHIGMWAGMVISGEHEECLPRALRISDYHIGANYGCHGCLLGLCGLPVAMEHSGRELEPLHHIRF